MELLIEILSGSGIQGQSSSSLLLTNSPMEPTGENPEPWDIEKGAYHINADNHEERDLQPGIDDPIFKKACSSLSQIHHPFLEAFIPLFINSKNYAPDIADALRLDYLSYGVLLFEQLGLDFVITILSTQEVGERHKLIIGFDELIRASKLLKKQGFSFSLTPTIATLLSKCGSQAHAFARLWHSIAVVYPRDAHEKNFEKLVMLPENWDKFHFLTHQNISYNFINKKGFDYIMQEHIENIIKYQEILSLRDVQICLSKHNDNKAAVEEIILTLYKNFNYTMYKEVLDYLSNIPKKNIKPLSAAVEKLSTHITPQAFSLLCAAAADDLTRITDELLAIATGNFMTIESFYIEQIQSVPYFRYLSSENQKIIEKLLTKVIEKAPQDDLPQIAEKFAAVLQDRQLSFDSKVEKINKKIDNYLEWLKNSAITATDSSVKTLCFSQETSPLVTSRKKESFHNIQALK